ncbi:hypothetical protein K5I29_12910 [Flavobacterium agricola]|uniref:Long-subunit fatty acid transport protein n=1 Tax=Flavobacterium agricola TaxID=2870839 RepID=A0ABY6M0G9_9FLAO|nr:hypothetical protein [Flavobacterium agricola]UYW01317.1 hypothetical protein K5I29_12910 [Flavobacterium agricola]
MIKKIIFSASILFSTVALAQTDAGSPYSFFGLGDQKFIGTNEHRAMGGLSVIGDSIHLNLNNPASYADLALTTFSFGGSNKSYSLQSDQGKESINRTALDYLAIGLPITKKSGVSFGLMPVTSVGYKIQNQGVFDGLAQSVQYSGSGGLNKVYVGFGYKITKELSVGADAQYYFGSADTKTLLATQGVQYLSRSTNVNENRGVAFNVGAMYQTKIKKYDFHSSATFTPQSNLTSTHVRNIGTVILGNDLSEFLIEERRIDVPDSKFKLPATYSVGTSFGLIRKWMIGAQATFSDSKGIVDGVSLSNLKYNNSSRFTLGGYYVPKYNSFNSYFSRVTYRAGIRYEDTGMELNNQKINDFAVSAGLGLPLGLSFSNLNLGFEYGTRGTQSAGLIKENYFMITLGLSFNDRWFQKVKYN